MALVEGRKGEERGGASLERTDLQKRGEGRNAVTDRRKEEEGTRKGGRGRGVRTYVLLYTGSSGMWSGVREPFHPPKCRKLTSLLFPEKDLKKREKLDSHSEKEQDEETQQKTRFTILRYIKGHFFCQERFMMGAPLL